MLLLLSIRKRRRPNIFCSIQFSCQYLRKRRSILVRISSSITVYAKMQYFRSNLFFYHYFRKRRSIFVPICSSITVYAKMQYFGSNLFFYHYLRKICSILVRILASQSADMLVRSFPMRSSKGLARDGFDHFVHTPAFFMSLIQTAPHKMATCIHDCVFGTFKHRF